MTNMKQLGLCMGIGLAFGTVISACDPESPELLHERALEGNEMLNDANQIETAFELDGNAMDSQVAPGVDWSAIVSGASDMAKAQVFIADPAPYSTFTGGGSKDTQGIGSWRYKDGSVPDKDDITNAYAAAYNNPDGDLLIYFGADRYANDGDAILGFWFFQDQVKLGASGKFQGQHKNGDLLILANFSNDSAQIEALEWMNGALTELDSTNAACNSGQATHQCAIANSASTDSPWNYLGKGGNGDGPFPAFTFFEGAVNLTTLFQQQNGPMPCFASFMVETRSSSSLGATLKDFAIGSFPVCGLNIAAMCNDSTLDADQTGFTYSFGGTVTNSGLGTIHGTTVTVSTGGGPTEIDLGEIAPGASKPFVFEFDSPEKTATLSATVTASTVGPDGPYDLESSLASQPTCHAPVHHPALSLHNACDLDHELLDGKLVVAAAHQRWVCNDTPVPEGEDNSISMDIDITDLDTNTVIESFADVPAKTCVYFDLQEYPSSLNANLSISSNLRATGKTALYPDAELIAEQMASCALCL
jgi:hypothetical protein